MISPPKLILVDLDGTLLGLDDRVSERNSGALGRARAAGARVVVATGRPARQLDPIRGHSWSPTVLCSNGAIVLDLESGNILATNMLPGDCFLRAIRRLRDDGSDFVVATEGMPDVGLRAEPGFRMGVDLARATLDELCAGPIVKGLIRTEAKDFDRIWALLANDESLTITRSGIPGLIELSGPGVNKGRIIGELASTWGVTPDDAIAFGDMPNDIEMLRWAGWGVAMANAENEVKLIANEVADHHDSDAVGRILERWF
jgi:Cof subfamily protein (haloacid dehalogenase superfamily)